MSEDPVRKYLDAKAQLDAAFSKVRDLISTIAPVATALNNPYFFMVSNVDVGFPPEVAMGGAKFTLNANDWPSAKQIAEKLASLHQARKHAISCWMSLSDPDKKNLTPPEPM